MASWWIPLAVLYLAGGALLGLGFIFSLVALPLLGLVLKILALIEPTRASLFLAIAGGEPHAWRENGRGFVSSLKQTDWWRTLTWREISWRSAFNALSCALLPIWTMVLVVVWPTTFVVGYRLLVGDGIVLTGNRRVLTDLDAGGVFFVVTAVCVTLVALLYLTVGLAWFQAQLALQVSPKFDRLQRQVRLLAVKETNLVSAFEAERLRIERQLHDGPQQNLAAAAIHLGLAQVLVRQNAENAEQHLALAQGQLQEASEELRSALSSLRPRTLVEDGLAASIAELVTGSPLEVELNQHYSVRAPFSVESSLHFVTSEFLTNTYRHARARTVAIELGSDEEGLRLLLRDDGVGGANADHGTGILGMVNRLSMLGADFCFTSPPGGPTTLDARINSDRLQEAVQ